MKAPTKLTKNFRQHFEELVDELDGNAHVDIVELEFGEPATEEIFRTAQEAAGTPLPWELRAFFREMDGFKLRWLLRNAEDLSEELEIEVPEEHSIVLLPLLSAEAGLDSRIAPQGVFGSWPQLSALPGLDEPKLVRPVDRFIEEGCVGLYPFPGKPTMHLHVFGERNLDTGRSFGQYLALLLQSRGFWFWQYSLLEEGQDREEIEAFRTAMPVLFPDYDDDLFQPLE